MAQTSESLEFNALDGAIYDDNWITRELKLEVHHPAAPGKLRLSFWNPDFAPGFLDNVISVKTEHTETRSAMLGLGEVFDVELHLKGAQTSTVIEIRSEAGLEADALDDRARSVLLTGIRFIQD